MTFIASNVGTLLSGIDLLKSIDDDLYSKSEYAVCSSAIGGHIRHIVDYYGLMLSGAIAGRIDYDLRDRDPLVESDRQTGVARLQSLVDQLDRLDLAQFPTEIAVKVDSPDGEPIAWSVSSIERELQFILSHTVHHFALIATIARLNGYEPGTEFGVATSTLRYLKERGACAP
ncbi:MAG: hypothetical protein ACI8TQ_001789 [Planctomycetota bacterium]|jgi:hypothetical protein